MRHSKIKLLGLAMACVALPSCMDSGDDAPQSYANALVTVKSTDDNKTFLQLDHQTTLFPQNLTTQLYGGKEVRALMSFSELDKQTPGFSKTVHVNWIDSIRTKDMVAIEESSQTEKYGNDPLEIVNDWVTIAEDGYLTLRVRTLWGNIGTTHTFNLLGGMNPDNPFEVELRHNANGDIHGRMGDALIAFRLSALPKQYPTDQNLTLKWKSFNGEFKKAYFNMIMNSTTNHSAQDINILKSSVEIN